MKIRCLIVDDEPLAIDVIRCFVQRFDMLEIAGTCESALEAIHKLQQEKIDLLFLDIQMPLLDGLELLQSLKNPPKVIITTAYRDYAVESFELEVLDYLVKPIAFSRFVKAVSRVMHDPQTTVNQTTPLQTTPAISAEKPDSSGEYILLKVDKRTQKILLRDIVYIESLKDYIRVVTESGQFITYQTLNGITEKLPGHLFMRIHKSYTVAIQCINAVQGNELEIKGKFLPIGRVFKEAVLERIYRRGILGSR